MGRTHMLLGINILWVLEALPATASPVSDSHAFILIMIGAGIGSLLPDLDANTSLLQNVAFGGVRPLSVVGRFAHRYFGHRGFLHSFLALAIWSALFLPAVIISPELWMGLSLGYFSHLLGDASTRSGVRLLYPNRRIIHVLPRPFRLVTGSPAEEVIFALLGIGALSLLLRHIFQPIW